MCECFLGLPNKLIFRIAKQVLRTSCPKSRFSKSRFSKGSPGRVQREAGDAEASLGAAGRLPKEILGRPRRNFSEIGILMKIGIFRYAHRVQMPTRQEYSTLTARSVVAAGEALLGLALQLRGGLLRARERGAKKQLSADRQAP